jgi:hypothetical protein
LLQELDRGAKAVAHGAVWCAFCRGAQAVTRDAATLLQQEKSNSVDFQRSRESIAVFNCTDVS